MLTCIFEDGGKGNLRHVVTDAIVIKEDKILLVKRAKDLLEGGKWGLIGGFVKTDESVEDCLKREVLEETGYELKKSDFFTIIDNPKRLNDIRQSVAFVYICYAGEKIGMPDNESSEQKWFDLNNLPNNEQIAFDHLQTINLYISNKNISFPKLLKY